MYGCLLCLERQLLRGLNGCHFPVAVVFLAAQTRLQRRAMVFNQHFSLRSELAPSRSEIQSCIPPPIDAVTMMHVDGKKESGLELVQTLHRDLARSFDAGTDKQFCE